MTQDEIIASNLSELEKANERIKMLEDKLASIKQAIAELESQEPVAYYNQDKVLCFSAEPKEGYKPVYTTPPQPAPVQEPVGEFKQSPHGNYLQLVWKMGYVAQQGDKLYTNPPAQPPQRTEQNFCPRCGKRTADLTTIHTCTPPKEGT
jgi:hypothetical protein